MDRAEAQMKTLGDPVDMFEHAYAELPAYLRAQKEEFKQELAELNKETDNG